METILVTSSGSVWMGGRCGVEVACFALFDRQELEREVGQRGGVRAAFFMSLYLSRHWVLFGISVRIWQPCSFASVDSY